MELMAKMWYRMFLPLVTWMEGTLLLVWRTKL